MNKTIFLSLFFIFGIFIYSQLQKLTAYLISYELFRLKMQSLIAFTEADAMGGLHTQVKRILEVNHYLNCVIHPQFLGSFHKLHSYHSAQQILTDLAMKCENESSQRKIKTTVAKIL
jgi:hypothetical protein